MSADNGIYVAEFPDGTYRVAYASAIDNCLIDYYGELLQQSAVVQYFGKSSVYDDKNRALSEAVFLAEQYPYLEYGVSHIKIPFNFPNMTYEEAVAIEDRLFRPSPK